ncbi:MAG: family hydrolase [Solirubrobacterales bacterium]|nr:family hydrolase [Solirubrobacterales bacterium]
MNLAPPTPAARAVLLDALGTLIGLEQPAPHLRAELAARGIHVTAARAAAAMRAEMAHYRAEHHRGGTPEGLVALRRECAGLMAAALGPPAARLDAAQLQEVLLASLHFFAYPEVPGVLRHLRAAGRRLVICSNWDLSLYEVLAATGLDVLVDGVVVSAVEGIAKPDPGLLHRALRLAGVPAAEAVHVGDSVAADVRGAHAAGVRPVLVRRSANEVGSADEDGRAPAHVPVIADLEGLLRLVVDG